jgi:hypothetical protein
MCWVYVRVRVCLGLELGYGTFVSTLGLVSFWLKLGWAGLLWAGGWSVVCWSSLVVFGLGTRMVKNEITFESAYVQH